MSYCSPQRDPLPCYQAHYVGIVDEKQLNTCGEQCVQVLFFIEPSFLSLIGQCLLLSALCSRLYVLRLSMNFVLPSLF